MQSEKTGSDDFIYKAELHTQMREQVYGTKEGWEVGWIGRLGLPYIRYWYYV